MSPEPEQPDPIAPNNKLGEPDAQAAVHTAIRLTNGAVVDRYTNPREKSQPKHDPCTLDYGLSGFAAGINEQRRRFRRHRR